MYRFEIYHKSSILPDIIVKSHDDINNDIQILNHDYNKLLNDNKNNIEMYYDNNIWDRMKKIINPYELIYVTNKKVRYNSVALNDPLSRSFFKMIEMSHLFLYNYYINPYINISNYKEPTKTLHLAEGPGGFVEGWRYFRNHNKNDKLYAITLLSKNKEIPGWKKTNSFLKNNPQVKILNGIDKTGNLYNPNNIKYVINRLGCHSMDVITGDGGFDFSIGYNIQEQYASKLVFCQVLLAIKCQKIGGTFICKFFDTNTKFTIDILYLLQCLYDKVTIYKPYTSRVANSERYIICNNYLKHIDNIYWEKLLSILVIWNNMNIENETYCISKLLYDIPIGFCKLISSINYNTIQNQINYINQTIDLIENNKSDEWYIENRKKQYNNALQWCVRFNVPYC